MIGNSIFTRRKEKLKSPADRLVRGQYFVAKGDIDRAIMEYKKALDRNPEHLVGNYFMGNACFAKSCEVLDKDKNEHIRWECEAKKYYHYVLRRCQDNIIAESAQKKLSTIEAGR